MHEAVSDAQEIDASDTRSVNVAVMSNDEPANRDRLGSRIMRFPAMSGNFVMPTAATAPNCGVHDDEVPVALLPVEVVATTVNT